MTSEAMEFDVLIIGAGPAGLAAAIRLKQRSGEALSVCVIDKGQEIGAHILSGAVIETGPLDALLPEDHPLAQDGSVRLEQLADTPFLLYQRSFMLNERLLQACHQSGFTPKEGGRSGQSDFLVALVAAGQGVVLLPSVVARALVRPGVVRLKLIAPDYLRWDIAFIWRDGAYLSRAAQAWLELLRERPVIASVP